MKNRMENDGIILETLGKLIESPQRFFNKTWLFNGDKIIDIIFDDDNEKVVGIEVETFKGCVVLPAENGTFVICKKTGDF